MRSGQNTGTSNARDKLVGVVVVAHSNLAAELVRTAKSVLGDFPSVAAVSVEGTETLDKTKKRILKAIKKVDHGAGTIILTDLMGGTATNLSLEATHPGGAQVLAGVNLPILIKLGTLRKGDPRTLLRTLRLYGQRQIIEASSALERQLARRRAR